MRQQMDRQKSNNNIILYIDICCMLYVGTWISVYRQRQAVNVNMYECWG